MSKKQLIKYSRYITDTLGIKMYTINLNPNDDLHAKDCSIRAIARLTNLPYEQIRDELFEEGRQRTSLPNRLTVIAAVLKNHNYKRIDKKLWYGQSLAQFMAEHKTGRYAICSGEHIFAYINGTWYDNKVCLRNPDLFICRKIVSVYELIK